MAVWEARRVIRSKTRKCNGGGAKSIHQKRGQR
jgi:hypothetical protein